MAYGMKSHVLITMQDSFGTSMTGSQYALPIISESLNHTITPLVEKSMYARFAESPYHEGQHAVAGDIQMEAKPRYLGFLLKSVIGQTGTTSGTGTQTHVFKPRTSDFDARAAGMPATFEVYRDTGSAFQYYDMVGNQLTFNISNSQLLNVTASFMGAGFAKKAAGTPTFTTEKPFLWNQVSASYNGATITDIKDMTVTFNNNLEQVYTLTFSKAPFSIKRTAQQTCEVAGTMLFTTHSYHQALIDQLEVPLVLNFASTEAPNVLKMDFPSLRIKTFDVMAGGTGLLEAKFTAQAVYNAGSGTALQITLVNTEITYGTSGTFT